MNNFSEKRNTLLSYRRLRAERTAHQAGGRHLHRILDEGSFTEMDSELQSQNPLHFPEYEKTLAENRMRTGQTDACIAGTGRVSGIPVVCAELCREFMMGSMGTAAGEKLTRSFEEAEARKLPLIIFSASGGARMQEGMFSLLQMVKTSAAAKRFRDRGGLYISVLTNPTTGGVSASYANLGDIILAEPNALIGFAGPRVIEQTIGEKLPKGFQRSEFQLSHGFVDRIVKPEDMRQVITGILKLHGFGNKEGRTSYPEADQPDSFETNLQNSKNRNGMKTNASLSHEKKSAYEHVLLARSEKRPKVTDFITGLFEDFMELDGDRLGKEDPAILGGIALLYGRPVTVIGHRKGKNLKENMSCRFGMPEPQGYRKALRLTKQAEKFGRPVITFIDTPGAYPGKDAEEDGQSTAIAENLAEMSTLRVPVLSIVTGEGNSGGALALSVGDSVWMLENAVYSVLSPEGFASILWKDSGRMQEACDVMKMTAQELYSAGLSDRIIPEPEAGLENDFPAFCMELKREIRTELDRLGEMSTEALLRRRYEKYRHIEGSMAATLPRRKEAGKTEG